MSPIPINKQQNDHVNRLKQIASNNIVFLDLSKMGTGKTFHALLLAKEFGLKLLVVCPANLRNKWNNVINQNSMQDYIVDIISYEGLRGYTKKEYKPAVEDFPENGILGPYKSSKTLQHGLLQRNDTITYKLFKQHLVERIDTYHDVSFDATSSCKDINNTLIVVDEIQAVKNDSTTTKAVQTLNHCYIHDVNTTNKVLLMSGSPVDKKEHVTQLLKTMGLLNTTTLFKINRKIGLPLVQLEGLNELENVCYKNNSSLTLEVKNKTLLANPQIKTLLETVVQPKKNSGIDNVLHRKIQETNDILDNFHNILSNSELNPKSRFYIESQIGYFTSVLNKSLSSMLKLKDSKKIFSATGKKVLNDEISNYVYSLFIQVIVPEISSTCEVIQNNLKVQLTNGFFRVPLRDLTTITNASDSILQAISFDKEKYKEFSEKRHDVLKCITLQMQKIEQAKVSLLIRIIKAAMTSNPCLKIVVGVSYTNTIELLQSKLQSYNILILNGSVQMKERDNIVKKFQQPNTDHRILIGNLKVISTGIDLDDQDGNYPRLALILPNYDTITQYQFAGRILRAGTKSNAYLLSVYAKMSDPIDKDGYENIPLDVFSVFSNSSMSSENKTVNNKEISVLDALIKKSTVINDISGNQSNNMLPGIAPEWIE